MTCLSTLLPFVVKSLFFSRQDTKTPRRFLTTKITKGTKTDCIAEFHLKIERRAGFQPVSFVTASRRRNLKMQARIPAPQFHRLWCSPERGDFLCELCALCGGHSFFTHGGSGTSIALSCFSSSEAMPPISSDFFFNNSASMSSGEKSGILCSL